MTRAIILARFSPRPDADISESNEAQEQICREYCARLGYEVAGVFADADAEGDDWERPGLWGAIAALGRGMVLVVWKRSRLARDPYLHAVIARKVRKLGARIEATTGAPNGDSPQDELVRGILDCVDRFNKLVQALDTKMRMLAHQRGGRMMGSKPPYGKRRGPDRIVQRADGAEVKRRTLIDDPHEQRVLAVIRELHSQGLRARRIAAELTRRGLKPRNGHWSVGTLGKILKRIAPAAAGNS